MIHDISLRLPDRAVPYPGDPPFACEFLRAIGGGDSCNLSSLAMSLHRGTHLDAPLHFLDGGKSLDAYPLERFVLPAVVVDVPSAPAVLAEHLAGLPPLAGQAVLLRTDNSRRGWCHTPPFRDDFVHLSLPAARRLIDLQASLVGIDYPTIEARGDPAHPVHRALLAADVLILEGLDLSAVRSGRYTLQCLPLPLKATEASPVRAALIS